MKIEITSYIADQLKTVKMLYNWGIKILFQEKQMNFTITFKTSFFHQGIVEHLTQSSYMTDMYMYMITSKYKYTTLQKYKLLRRNGWYVWENHSKRKNTFCDILHLQLIS